MVFTSISIYYTYLCIALYFLFVSLLITHYKLYKYIYLGNYLQDDGYIVFYIDLYVECMEYAMYFYNILTLIIAFITILYYFKIQIYISNKIYTMQISKKKLFLLGECLLCRDCKVERIYYPCMHAVICGNCEIKLNNNNAHKYSCVYCNQRHTKILKIVNA